MIFRFITRLLRKGKLEYVKITSNTMKSLISSIYLPLQMLNLFQPTDILKNLVQKENSSAQNNQKSHVR